MATIRHYNANTMKCITESEATERTGSLSDLMRDADAMTDGDVPLRTDNVAHNGSLLFNYDGSSVMVVVKCTLAEEHAMLSDVND